VNRSFRASSVLASVLFLGACRASSSSQPSTVEAGIARGPSAPASADVLSHASTLEDSGASAHVQATSSVDGAALRAKNLQRLHDDRSPVTLLRSEAGAGAALELGRRICEAVVPKRPPDTPVLLKPNIGGFEWFKDPAKNGGDDGVRGRTTDPEFVRGVIQCLRARGHQAITIAEGWGATHKDWERLVRTSGYQRMADEEHVPLVAMDDDGVFDVVGDQPGKAVGIRGIEGSHVPTLLMPKILAEHLAHGLFLSLPKIKAHRFGVVSMSVKGMQGTVMLSDAAPAFRQKWRMHRELNPYLDARKKPGPDDRAAYVTALETFAERMADVLELEAPDAVLAEGAPAMGGDGFQKLWAIPESIAIGGTNPILVDRVGAEWLGLWDSAQLARALGGHRTSPLIEAAARRFRVDATSPTIVGDGASLLGRRRPVHFVGMAPFAIHSDDTLPTPLGLPFLDESPAVDAGGPGDTGDLPETGAAAERPTARAAALGSDVIVLDGRGDEAAWKRAEPATWETDYAGTPTGIRTRVRFLTAPDALYALFELEGAGLHADRSRPTNVPRPRLYEEDCVELFLTPDPSRPRHYYEVELGPFGHYFDVEVDLDTKKSNTEWTSGAQIAVMQDAAARTARIEAKLSSPDITGALVPGRRLPMGLFRMEGTSPRRYLAWSPPRTARPNFHVPEAFGALALPARP
jgi:uncharacterized protein (DUF362 family)